MTAVRYPTDPTLRDLIDELTSSSARFTELWESADDAPAPDAARHKVIDHPTVGPITVDCDTLVVAGDDLRIMGDRADLYPHQLSGGQRQRVGIARALALKPAVLLSDEATSGLDPQATTSFLNLLGDVRDELGLAVVFITHEMDVITRIADRAGRLDHGRIVEQGAVADLVLDPDSVLGKALRPRGTAAPAAPGRSSVEVTYNSAAVPPDWIARVSSTIGTTVGVLGANIQSVDGVTAGALTVSVEDHSLDAFTAAAATYGITVGAGLRSQEAAV